MRIRRAGCVTVLALAGVAAGQDAEPAGKPAAVPPSPAPPAPQTGDFDWMQFNNGEWLKGEIKDLQTDKFNFDSDELDDLKLDFKDIYRLSSPKVNTLVLKDRSTVEGSFVIEGDRVTVHTADGEKTFRRDQLMGIIPGEMNEWNFWSGRLSLGGTIREGNVNETDISLFLRLQRRSPGSRLVMEYNGAYSTVEGNKTANNHRLAISNDVYLTPRFYLRLPSFNAFSDEFQNIRYRLTPGAGVGYDVVDRPDLEWTVAGGFGYQFTRFDSEVPGSPDSQDETVLLLGTRVDWEATPKIDVFAEYSLAYALFGRGNNNMHLAVGMEIDVWGDLGFDIQLIVDRQSNPAPNSDGTIPKTDDVRLFFGLGWEF